MVNVQCETQIISKGMWIFDIDRTVKQTLPSWTFSVASHNLKPTKGSLSNFAFNIKQID